VGLSVETDIRGVGVQISGKDFGVVISTIEAGKNPPGHFGSEGPRGLFSSRARFLQSAKFRALRNTILSIF